MDQRPGQGALKNASSPPGTMDTSTFEKKNLIVIDMRQKFWWQKNFYKKLLQKNFYKNTVTGGNEQPFNVIRHPQHRV